MSGLHIALVFLGLGLLGVPLAVSMGLAATAYIVIADMPLATVAHRMSNAINSFPLLAVILFIYVGNLLNSTGITTHLFRSIRVVVGRVRGGLAYVTVVANVIMAGISGAALADIGALGNIQIKAMKDQGYDKIFATCLTGSAATIGPIFPPSIPLVIYASVADTSAVKLLIAGILPALLIALCLSVQIFFMARKNNFPRDDLGFSFREGVRTILVAVPALATPVILVAGLLLGLFGPTELAAFTVAYALFLGCVVYRELTWKKFVDATLETIHATATIMFIVSAAAIFAWALTVEQVPAQLTAMLEGVTQNPWLLLLMVNILLLVVGMFMESIAAIMVMTPLITPPLYAAGVDPVHLGLVVVFNLMIGLLTPPVGMSLYMLSIVSDVPVAKLARAIWPYLAPLLVALALVTFFPALTTWLPYALLGK